MGLASLDAALSGLRISQQQISVISNNVANVGTEGFTRKILPQTTQVISGVTVGVRPETIIRNVDLNLERDLWTQVSRSSFYNIQTEYLNRIQAFHGPPDSELSIAAEVGRLKDSFAALANNPADVFLQAGAVDEAQDTANKINDLSNLITTLRNDAQDEITTTITRINDLLTQIADLNSQISFQLNASRSTAATEDQRSLAIKNLSELMDISFFKRGDGVIVIQTNEGVELASTRTALLTFDPIPVSATTYYPDSAAGVYVGDPEESIAAVDITARTPGGKLGGLLTLRDTTFPKQMAQLDELAHKMALRFEAQGLRLFTDASGTVPADTAPSPEIPGMPVTPAVAVTYVGFSSQIRVNADIIDDPSLIQQGTYGATLTSGSNEVIRRVLEYTFSNTDFQQAIGDIDMRVSANAAPNNTLQNFLGLPSENTLKSTRPLGNVTQYPSIANLLTNSGTIFNDGVNQFDNFVITFDDPDFGGTYNIEIDLSTVAVSGVSAGQDLINAITADADWANAVTDFGASVTIGADGKLQIQSRGDVTIAAGAVDPVSAEGFSALGLSAGVFEATDPYFDIAVGNNTLTRITIEPTDNETDLMTKLQAVPGLAVEDITLSADGYLRIRPGNNYNTPDFGGDLKIISGPSRTSGAGANAVFGAGTIPDSINVVSALFGSFNAGPPAQDTTATTSVSYGSQTNGTLTPPIPTTAFRSSLLGPNATVSTGILGASGLLDFAQKIINEQTQEQILIEERGADEQSLKDILEKQLLDDSAVNLDEELGYLIVVQTAYAASARVINAVDSLFQELLNAVG